MTGRAEPRARRLVEPVVAPGRDLSSLVSWTEIPFGLTYTDQKRE